MNWSSWARKIHRWSSIAFTAGFISVSIATAAAPEEPAEWVYLLPVLPLGLLLITGLYLFALPHAARLRGRRPAGGPRPTAR